MSLSPIQQSIVDTSGNMVVNASAGTGKTHTMVAKIAKDINSNSNHKVIAAITFTIKAAKEIRDRLALDCTEHFIGTNNSFAIEEIIKPFARDVYGEEYNFEMCTDYSIRKTSYQECMNCLKEEKIICAYNDNEKNFVFELALNIVQKSKACKLFLKAKYFKIYVDEYQDCDRTMHDFFMYLCNELNIEFFIVGDKKQSIYIWRGAYPEAFQSILNMKSFHKKELKDNYRSCQIIQNYSNLLNDDTRHLYKRIENNQEIILVNTSSTQWLDDISPYLDVKKDTALLRYSNNNARSGAMELSKTGTDFVYVPKTPISDITTNDSWIYSAIAQFFILPKYSVYDFLNEIPEESIGDKKIINFLKTQLDVIKLGFQEKNAQHIYEATERIANFVGYEVSKENTNKMIQTIAYEQYHPAFRLDELTHVAITFHASKGLEYEQVIVFANDYALNKEESIYNHYVAVTRAKSKLFIIKLNDIDAWTGEKYCENLRQLFSKSGVELNEVITTV